MIEQKLKLWLKNKFKKDSLLWSTVNHVYHICKLGFNPKGLYVYILRNFCKNAVFVFENCPSLFPKNILDEVLKTFSPRSILDLGCGNGRALDYFHSKEIEIIGVECSKSLISAANHPELIIRYDLRKELNLKKKFDLIWAFEFVEHIHPKYLGNLMKTFSNHSGKVIISAAQPGQTGDGHFNEQPESYWISQFEKYGYRFRKDITNKLRKINDIYNGNMLVFER